MYYVMIDNNYFIITSHIFWPICLRLIPSILGFVNRMQFAHVLQQISVIKLYGKRTVSVCGMVWCGDVLCCVVSYCPVLSCPALSVVLSCAALSCPVLSCPVPNSGIILSPFSILQLTLLAYCGAAAPYSTSCTHSISLLYFQSSVGSSTSLSI